MRKLNRTVRKVRRCQREMAQLSDSELAGLTQVFKERLAEGEEPEDILPEAFAAVCEADRRILGLEPYDVQILGGVALYRGYLAEMNTGEGKTLVATLPLYLNALTGKSTILVTTNEYLALRDAEEMGRVYRFMGLTVRAGVSADGERHFTNQEKQEIYAADIVYTTHSVLGFDYLLNNLVTSAEERFLREFDYIIIDEADSVLLDSAQTPLVISGSPRVQSNLYELANFFVTTLKEGEDYLQEEKKVWLTEHGIRYAECFFRIDNFYGREHFEINRHVILALRAHVLFRREEEYMISKENELYLLDGASGRMMPGVKLRGGQHQALEVKEGLEISQENRSVASITYQNLFLLFPRMAGMSGTISDAGEELLKVYHEKVLVIPPRRPVIRRDMPDRYYRSANEQFKAAISLALSLHAEGRPVLIVVSTIGETELVSRILVEEKVPHNVLNANNAFWEADIIREAGQMHAVTVATSMAGRGTDIKLGPGVKELGGLAVIGIGRMFNIRQERQARGRAGRQGDPGSSYFFVSLEDEVVTQYGGQKTEKYIRRNRQLGRGRLKRIINTSQRLGEEFAVLSRKQAVDYDQVLQKQRSLIYEMRDRLMDGEDISKETLLQLAEGNVERFLAESKKTDIQKVRRYILDHISYQLDDEADKVDYNDKKAVKGYLMGLVEKSFEAQKGRLPDPAVWNHFLRVATLTAIDEAWVEQVDYLQQLQAAVVGRTSAQRNPVYEFQRDGLESFCEMEKTVLRNMIRNILLSIVYVDAKDKLKIVFP